MNQQRGHVDELAGSINVDLLQVLGVLEELAGDAGNGDVVDVDILLANKVKQKVERTVVDLAHGDRKRRLRGLFLFFVFCVFRRSGAFLVGRQGDGFWLEAKGRRG